MANDKPACRRAGLLLWDEREQPSSRAKLATGLSPGVFSIINLSSQNTILERCAERNIADFRMKKLITPIIYGLFLFPNLAVAMGSIEYIANKFNLLPNYIDVFRIPYLFLIIGIILLFGIPCFWLANHLLRRIEKYNNPTFTDHFRQALFYYFIIICVFTAWIFIGYSANEDDVYFLTGLTISAVAIIINFIFLLRERSKGAMIS